MNLLEAIFLGVVQGITEFLPISSSGHLVILQTFMGITEGAFTFDALIHFGSLAAVIIAFRQDLWAMVYGVFGGKGEAGQQGRRLFLYLIMATLPLVFVGLFFRDFVNAVFHSVYVSIFMLYLTGILLWLAEHYGKAGRQHEVKGRHALVMGLSQTFSVLPGLSRSGTTIAAGIMSGLDRQTAARFSFLMSIPANLGASLLEARQIFRATEVTVIPADIAVAGVLAAGISSYLAIKLLLRFLQHGRLLGFAYYTWILATVVLFITFFSGAT